MNTDDSFVTDWFKQFCSDARGDNTFRWFDGGTPGRMLLEVLSDAASELFCSAVLAAHLRRFGAQRLANDRFWARCEWAKFDLCYGIATDTFPNWNAAWAKGLTGDLGTIEVKVLYGHYADSKILGKIAELSTQLQARRRQIVTWRGHLPQGHEGEPHAYHGLLLFAGEEVLPTRAADKACQQVKLTPIVDWTKISEMTADELKVLWPRSDIRGSWELKAQLVTVASGG